jgi:4,5-DOPA dioxygenase extradiol
MRRREAIKSGIILSGVISMGNLRNFFKEIDELNNSFKMPLLFVGHGSPMNAIEENRYSRTWKELGESLPVPKAILSVSAHWLTHGTTKVAAMPWPETIHDFGGFPKELFNVQYPASGSPDFAAQTIKLLQNSHVEADLDWGLDHGTWSVLVNMYPQANIPVYQLSIDYSKPPEYHFNLMKELKILRTKGILVMGSGNIVHNLSMLKMSGEVFPWTIEFDALITEYIDKGDYQSVVNFQKSGSLARLAHPTYDHFLPLLYTLGMADKADRVTYFNEGFDMGSISMRSLLLMGK